MYVPCGKRLVESKNSIDVTNVLSEVLNMTFLFKYE